MDLFPLWNSIRISGLSSCIAFFLGIFAANYIAKIPRSIKGAVDAFLTLPMVLPPTVMGFLVLMVISPNRPFGHWIYQTFGFKIPMTWWSAVISTSIIIFPLMYRTARGAFEAFDKNLAASARCLGMSDWQMFWKVQMPTCKAGILAGLVLAFARGLGEYGATSMVAGYIPGRTATISTTVYQLWRTDNEALALKWVLINLAISFAVLFVINIMENSYKTKEYGRKE